MPFPIDPGHQQYSGTLIPQIWSPRLLEKFYEFSVLEAIANTNWEGEVRNLGDKVNIRLRPDINISSYVKGQDLDVQIPEQGMTELVIDRGEYWKFLVEDVDRAQSDLDYMEEWTEDAAEAMNEKINETVLGEVYADAHAANQGAEAGIKTGYFDLGAAGAPVGLTPENVVGKLGECATVLSENKVPRSKRWLVAPPWLIQLIYDSPSRNHLVSGQDQDLLRKQHVGRIAGFEIFESNQLAMVEDGDDDVTNIIFGHETGITFASQLVNSEVIRSERKFGVFARGLNVYGFNTVKEESLGLLYATRASE